MKKSMICAWAVCLVLGLSGCGEKKAEPSSPAPQSGEVETETEAEITTEITYEESGEMETENFDEETGEILEEISVDSFYNVDKDVLTVELTTDPESGYVWTCIQSDETILEQKSMELFDDDEASGLVGEEKVAEYTFQALAEGETVLCFFYLSEEDELDIPEDAEMEDFSDLALHVKVSDTPAGLIITAQ